MWVVSVDQDPAQEVENTIDISSTKFVNLGITCTPIVSCYDKLKHTHRGLKL